MRHHAEQWGDDVTATGAARGAEANGRDVRGVNASFLVGLAQGGCERRFAGLEAAAWETDLAGVGGHVGRAHGEQQVPRPLNAQQGHEHRGRTRPLGKAREVGRVGREHRAGAGREVFLENLVWRMVAHGSCYNMSEALAGKLDGRE